MDNKIAKIFMNIPKKEKEVWKKLAIDLKITLTQLIISSVRAYLGKETIGENCEKLKVQLKESQKEILRLKELLVRNHKDALDETILDNLEDLAISKGWDALNRFQRDLVRTLLEKNVKLEDCIFLVNYFWDLDEEHEKYVLQKNFQFGKTEFQFITIEILEEWQVAKGECKRTIYDIIKDLEGREVIF